MKQPHKKVPKEKRDQIVTKANALSHQSHYLRDKQLERAMKVPTRVTARVTFKAAKDHK